MRVKKLAKESESYKRISVYFDSTDYSSKHKNFSKDSLKELLAEVFNSIESFAAEEGRYKEDLQISVLINGKDYILFIVDTLCKVQFKKGNYIISWNIFPTSLEVLDGTGTVSSEEINEIEASLKDWLSDPSLTSYTVVTK